MSALNRYYWPTKFNSRSSFLNQQVKCVFISYQNSDKKEAKKVADYLISAGINVYFDEYDGDLKQKNQKENPSSVTKSLCNGINNSSHMLVVISPTTIVSKWVPFEIGYGYDKTELAVLCLRGIPKGALPEYIQTAVVIRDIYDLNSKISDIRGTSKEMLIARNSIKQYNSRDNMLQGIMDSLINENY